MYHPADGNRDTKVCDMLDEPRICLPSGGRVSNCSSAAEAVRSALTLATTKERATMKLVQLEARSLPLQLSAARLLELIQLPIEAWLRQLAKWRLVQRRNR